LIQVDLHSNGYHTHTAHSLLQPSHTLETGLDGGSGVAITVEEAGCQFNTLADSCGG